MIDNETVRKASEIGIIDVVDAIKLIETNPAYITLTFDEKINMVIDFVYQQRYNETVRRLKKSAKLRYKRDNSCSDKFKSNASLQAPANAANPLAEEASPAAVGTKF